MENKRNLDNIKLMNENNYKVLISDSLELLHNVNEQQDSLKQIKIFDENIKYGNEFTFIENTINKIDKIINKLYSIIETSIINEDIVSKNEEFFKKINNNIEILNTQINSTLILDLCGFNIENRTYSILENNYTLEANEENLITYQEYARDEAITEFKNLHERAIKEIENTINIFNVLVNDFVEYINFFKNNNI